MAQGQRIPTIRYVGPGVSLAYKYGFLLAEATCKDLLALGHPILASYPLVRIDNQHYLPCLGT